MIRPIRFAALALVLASTATRAETLLGSSYAGGRFHVITLGDKLEDKAFGNAYGLDVFGSTPLNDAVETEISAGHARRDGSLGGEDAQYTVTFTRTDFRYQFNKNEPINPFVVGGPFVRRYEVDARSFANEFKSFNRSEDQLGLSLGGGAEIEITDHFLARAQAGVTYVSSGDLSVDGSASVGFWVLPQLLTSLGASYETENEDMAFSLLATWKLP
jgi:opacity protein-like surface antigen